MCVHFAAFVLQTKAKTKRRYIIFFCVVLLCPKIAMAASWSLLANPSRSLPLPQGLLLLGPGDEKLRKHVTLPSVASGRTPTGHGPCPGATIIILLCWVGTENVGMAI